MWRQMHEMADPRHMMIAIARIAQIGQLRRSRDERVRQLGSGDADRAEIVVIVWRSRGTARELRTRQPAPTGASIESNGEIARVDMPEGQQQLQHHRAERKNARDGPHMPVMCLRQSDQILAEDGD